jgi:hypothetical protein
LEMSAQKLEVLPYTELNGNIYAFQI